MEISLFKSEHDLQVALINYCDTMKLIYPDWGLIFAIPNGGFRNIIEASRLKKEGVRAGIPDLFLAVPNCGFSGLFLELKNGKKGKISKSQDYWLKTLSNKGYQIVIAYSLDEAIKAISDYLN